VRGPYDKYSISLNATHYESNFTELNLHSLYGHAMMRTTSLALYGFPELSDKRQFLLTRSTFAGTGRYASYAVKPKYRNWEGLRYAIPHLMNMNMFGFPHAGLDVCGFYEEDDLLKAMNEELCLRYMHVTAYLPLARHTQAFTEEQAYLTGPLGFTTPYYKDASKETLVSRLAYMRMMYTCMFEMTEFGGTCIDPLFYHFDIDTAKFETKGINDTFIASNNVKVSPVLDDSQEETFLTHFPEGRWVNLNDFSDVVDSKGEMKPLKKKTP
jgi:alpha-glucosidase (family GH31 glycosyl hydrolase)